MKTLRDWTLHTRHAAGADLLVEGRHLLSIRVLEHDLIRVSLKKDGTWRLDRTWCVAPGGEMPWQGRSRDELTGFACPAAKITDGETLVIETDVLRLTVSQPLHLAWAARIDGEWVPFVEQIATCAL